MRTCVIYGVCLLAVLVREVCGCGPGRGAGRRRRPHKLTPLVYKQHIPNVSENTLGASGPPEKKGPIKRSDRRFQELVANWNPNIIFKDEERTESDRMMTRRLREKLDYLAVSVRNQWPDVKLRVTEAWDEDNQHAEDSLHYQGRAADITTSDRDRSKYGMLARLAVEAGFDWVYYESRGHVHCSVKSDDSAAIRNGGCFPSTSMVTTPDGPKRMSQLRAGEAVQVATHDGRLHFSEVLLFLDRDDKVETLFLNIRTQNGRGLTLTPAHLIFSEQANSSTFLPDRLTAKYANELNAGDVIYTLNEETKRLESDFVSEVTQVVERGVYAPLTEEGNLVVDDTLVSCYAVVSSHELAHRTLAPLRWLSLIGSTRTVSDQVGQYWYVRVLYELAQYVLPQSMMFST